MKTRVNALVRTLPTAIGPEHQPPSPAHLSYLVTIQEGQVIAVTDRHFLSLLVCFLSLVKRG